MRRRRNLSRIPSQSVKELAGPSLKKMILRKPSLKKRLKRKKMRRQFKSSKSRLHSLISQHRKRPPKIRRMRHLKELKLRMWSKRKKRKERVMGIVLDLPVSEAKDAVVEEVIGVVISEKANEAAVNTVAEAEAEDEVASATKTVKMRMDLLSPVSASKIVEAEANEAVVNTVAEVEVRIEVARTDALLETTIVH